MTQDETDKLWKDGFLAGFEHCIKILIKMKESDSEAVCPYCGSDAIKPAHCMDCGEELIRR